MHPTNVPAKNLIPKRVKMFSHTDLDGHGGPIALSHAFYSMNPGIEMLVENHNYDTLDQAIIKFVKEGEPGSFDYIYILDMSPRDQEAIDLLEMTDSLYNNVLLIDHHQSALPLNRYAWAKVVTRDEDGVTTSATSMTVDYILQELAPAHERTAPVIQEEEDGQVEYPAWTYMSDEKLLAFGELVRSYDTWDWKKDPDNEFGEQARDFNDLLYLITPDIFVRRMHMQDMSLDLLPHEQMLLEIEKRKRNAYLKKKKLMATVHQAATASFVFVNAESYKNDVCEALKDVGDVDFIVLRDNAHFSLRRPDDSQFDLEKLASHFGGGGHPFSAGIFLEDHMNYSDTAIIEMISDVLV